MDQPRNSKGQFQSKPKQKPQELQNEKVMLIEERENNETKIGIFTLIEARKYAKNYGGSYIFKLI